MNLVAVTFPKELIFLLPSTTTALLIVTVPGATPKLNLPPANSKLLLEAAKSTLIVSPVLAIPSPAVIWPAPLNCVNTNAVVPTLIVPLFVKTNPLSPLVVPSSIKVNEPGVTF